MTAPVILVTGDVRNFENYFWHAATSIYMNAVVSGAGGIPLILPALGSRIDINTVLDRVDGVLATGSRTNVHPQTYGVMPAEKYEPYDPDRDATTLPLIETTIARGIPLLAVCRGFQELNVVLGGTLATEIQEQPGRMDHRAPASDSQDERFRLVHDLIPTEGGRLASIVGDGPIRINSIHRQGIDRLADGLTVEGVAPDGVIEAVSVTDAPAWTLGVQWHPEYWVDSDPPSKQIFNAFGDAVRARLSA
ncbi:MAG: gamma-glutamyl-gamma-aminobutyrate hydrolase [Hyphomicrobiales bacterium]|nr:MAG: gamma-glutamyl-gamma-aminobutyrate hydrolase [Hyphomicrobiales bacterium]